MYDIRTARKAAGLTQENLAKRIGVNRATLSKYESGYIEPSISKLAEIADALACPLYELLPPQIENMTIGYVDDELEREQELLLLFSKLNKTGQKVACERVEELSKIDDYRRTDAAQSEGGVVSPPNDKKPSERQETPSDGNK